MEGLEFMLNVSNRPTIETDINRTLVVKLSLDIGGFRTLTVELSLDIVGLGTEKIKFRK